MLIMRNLIWVMQLFLLLLLGGACAMYFEDGFDHYYTYSSESDILGLHNVTTVIKFRIRGVNSSDGGSLNMLMVDSFVQYSEKGYFMDNPLKWNLNREFLFFVSMDGLVTMIKTQATWVFTTEEEDHAGTFKHEYTGEKTSTGLKFQRTHTSSTNVLRSHNKTLHLDHKGTPLEVQSVDNVTLHHHTNTLKRTPMDGEEEILDEQSGDFPKIGSVSKNRLKLEAKRRHHEKNYNPPTNLKRDKLLIKHKEPAKVSLDSVENKIKQNLDCIRRYENKYETNRTECVNSLRKLLMSVHDDDFLALARKVLTRECDTNDTMCNDERSLFIDLVGGHGSSGAQMLFLELIVLQPNVSEEDTRRFLFHCIALKNPIPEVVQLVQDLCHSEIEYIEGVPSMTKTGKRACLSLGAMAKTLHDTNVTVSDRIVERLEAWLEPHNQTQTAEIIKPRNRRSVSQMDRSTRKHIETKMVLLQSLGNAAKKRSLDHIKSYLEPNTGHTVWRRAAAHSLRHFSCDESATALLKVAVHDDDDVVRQTAQKVLNKHPKSGNITREQEDIVLSKNYTYPIVSRVKRGAREILETLIKGFEFRFEAPGIEWDKTIGTKDIGASMGLTIRNLIDLKLSLMEGHFLIDVYDGAFAEAHVAMMDFQIDIIKAFVCFKGHINYNMNILKDFGINDGQDLLNIYDKIIEKIVNPIKAVIDGFKDIIQFFRSGSMTEVFNSFIATIKSLPTMFADLAKKVMDFLKDLYSIAGGVVIEELRLTIGHVRQFIDGVREDVLKFYSEVKDAVVTALPYIGKKVKEAFNLVVDAFKEIIDAPVQGFTAMTRGVSHIKTAVAMAVDIKDKIVETCMLVKGRISEWLNTAKVIPGMIRRIQTAYEKLSKTDPAALAAGSNSNSEYSDGVEPMKSSFTLIKEDLMAKWDQVLVPFRQLREVAQPFLDQFNNIKELVKGIKWAYKNLKDVIEIGKSLVQKVFGPKFHPSFITIRRKADGRCEAGMWPTTTNDNYQTTGVDLAIGVGQTIPSPVDAIVHVREGEKVVLKPTDTEFSEMEIVIENIEVITENGSADGRRFKAGETIGKGIKVDICKDNFIHLSVRQAQNTTKPDSEYQYIDPSLFLDKLNPFSKWIQECMDYEFRFIGQTFESGETEDGENNGEPVSKLEKLKRSFMDSIGSKEDLAASMNDEKIDRRRRGISDILGSVKDAVGLDWGEDFGNDIKEKAGQFKEFFKTSFFEYDAKVPDILDIVNTKDKSVGWIKEKLNTDSGLFSKLNGVIEKLSAGLTGIPTENAKIQPLTYLKRLFPSIEGGVTELAETLQTNAEKLCSMFVGAISSQHLCVPRCDCMGIVCTLQLPTAHKLTSLQIGFYLNLEDTRLEILFNNNLFLMEADGLDHDIDLGFKVLGMTIKLVGNIGLNLDKFSLTIEAKICSDMLQICFPNIEILTNIEFSKIKPEAIDSKDCSPDGETLGDLLTADGEVHNMSIPDFINSLGDFSMLTGNVTDIFDSLSEVVSNELMGEPVDEMGIVTVEFHDSVDFCIAANIKIPTFEVEFFNLRHIFMVGPVPLGLGFGAGGALGLGVKIGLCIMTMKLKVTLMPWLGGKVWGDVALDIGFARGGLRLIGYILETKFPITGELAFTKFPIDLGARLDLILVPIKLKLKGFAELNLFVKRITIFEGLIWEYACPTINKNIFTKHTLNKDMSPPEILPTTLNMLGEKRPKREGEEGCSVHQVLGRSHKDTAFMLEMNAQDPTSDVKMSYAIGTHRGGTNVQDWTDIGGFSILQPTELPGGIPLYWTMKARNSEGLEATAQCYLNTFDSTLPDGRVEHAYKYSSHPNKLIASVVVFEDSPLAETHYKAVGYCRGEFGSQFVDWQPMSLDHSSDRIDGQGNLKKFAVPRLGALIAPALQSQTAEFAEDCASVCLDYGSNCVSFDYESSSKTCTLHDRVQGANAYLRVSGGFRNYERLGTGYHAPLEYTDLELKHGTLYFVNAKVRNVLGYEAYLFGDGTMADFTPPEPGPVGNVSQDILRADGCDAAVTQQCLDVTWLENHRIIIDGPEGATIFNGHEPKVDKQYTLTNHYISANWDGFHDDESGIYGYTWAVGSQVCGTDILYFKDPHAHFASRSFWTNSGFEKGFHLSDGTYYVTVQALNNAELGGSLVTTVCHSTPFIVDTSAPVFSGVTEIVYDEDYNLIAIYYEATDDLSGIQKAEFGLGKTKYDVSLKSYSLHPAMDRVDPFVSVEDLGLQEGIPAWIRIRVTNNVDLFTAGHGDEPILIDRSPPLAGQVLDGDKIQRDLKYQSSDNRICAQWVNFYDSESGIDSFLWGVGTAPEKDDIVEYKTLSQYVKSICTAATLEHNRTYYSTVIAFNNALNSKPANASSDGVLVDTTPPVQGYVVDGAVTDKDDLLYTSETVTKACHWNGFSDPESGIEKYLVDVFVNNQLQDTFDIDSALTFEDKTISLEHNDYVHFRVHGVNGAELSSAADSDGFLVDHTPPALVEMSDSEDSFPFQSNNSVMHLSWHFIDEESGIKEFRTMILETKEGVKQKFWPVDEPYNLSVPVTKFPGKTDVVLENLTLKNGGKYSLHVTSLNGALLSTAHESDGVIIDMTAPNTPKVHIGLLHEDEDLNEEGQVLHSDQHGILVSWSGRDPESGIENFLVAVGKHDSPESLLPFTSYGTMTTATYIGGIYFEPSENSSDTYVVSVQATNGAGIVSPTGHSKPIFVQKANVAGVVFDGRTLYHDEVYTTDRTSLAGSFYGFESDTCNIQGYEWAVGTEAFGTNILTYTNYGVVMEDESHGYMQVHTELFENSVYYITVRAITGCRDEYIVASSNGITLDTKSPTVTFSKKTGNDTTIVLYNGVYYQDATDSVHLTATVEDEFEVRTLEWALGSSPMATDLHAYTSDLSRLTNAVTLTPGAAAFLTASTSDGAGNIKVSHSLPIIGDNTPPLLSNLKCTKHASTRQGLVTCEWDKVIEYESIVKDILISIGTKPQLGDVIRDFKQSLTKLEYSRDLTTYLKKNLEVTSLYIDFKVINVVGRINEYEHKIIVDRTPPIVQGVHVVTRTNDNMPYTTMRCQLPTSFIEISVESFEDAESGIDENRFEVAVGSDALGADIVSYRKVIPDSSNTFFLDGLTLPLGQEFYASIRSYNKAGLNGESSSEMVVVSQSPFLEVIDGASDLDIDFQTSPNIIQGSWGYSDDCPIVEASWMITDLLGHVVSDYQPILQTAKSFYSDEVKLEIGVKYFVTVKTFDALNRTKIAHSDGVTVRIQPPYPGIVRDGMAEDINYQFSVTELSANWDDFGDSSNDPTQSIDHYEVAIGNDLRYEDTRSNVHYFVDVGLNKSFTFTNLNLTAKIITFYITVRAYSFAGGLVEGYSNGIKVGFEENIISGTIASDRYQSSAKSIAFSWSKFQSDIGILQYIVGISSKRPSLMMDDLDCNTISTNTTIFDIAIEHVGLNEYVRVNDLSLNHTFSYYPSVMAEDDAGLCNLVTGHSITVDTTLPETGDIYINGLLSDSRLFALSATEMEVSWKGFVDPESGIESVKVTLLDCGVCDADHSTCFTLEEETAQNDTKVNFYELQLLPNNIYKIKLVVTNRAASSIETYSKVILLDISSPNAGVVKITNEWAIPRSFQFRTDFIHGKMAVTLSEDIYKCSNQIKVYPSVGKSQYTWDLLDKTFSKDFYVSNETGGFLGIGYNSDLSGITRTGILSSFLTLRDGSYSTILRCASGPNIVTTLAFVWAPKTIPYQITNKPIESDFDDSEFENKTGLYVSTNNETATDAPGILKPTNDSRESNTSYFNSDDFGYGIHLLGYKIENNIFYHGLFWAQSKYAKVERWFQLDFDPTASEHMYTIMVEKYISNLEELTDLTLIVDDVELVDISGLELGDEAKVAVLTWNENGSKPEIEDVFKPFYSDAFVKYIEVPNEIEKECRHGKAFFDGESGIKEIWVGISDNVTATDNISPLQLTHRFCPSCRGFCNESCGDPCSYEEIDEDYMIVDLERAGLHLRKLSPEDVCLNISSEGRCNSTSYYLTTKVVNFAGLVTYAHSNAIQVDITPPTCDSVKCLDPEHAEDEPVIYTGSSSTIGAYWNCTDDISLIDHYEVSVISLDGNSTLLSPTNVGGKSRVRFDFENGTFENNHDYIVQTTVINTAGMSASYDCRVRAYLMPPDVQSTTVIPIYATEIGSITTTHFVDSQYRIGIRWEGGKEDAEFYEWQLGTKPGQSDIFPPVLVGVNSTGTAAIVNGKLELNEQATDKSLAEFHAQDVDTINALEESSETEKTFFSMEPGRCVYHTVSAMGYSHLRSTLKSKPVCIKRSDDVVLQSSPTTTKQIISKPMSTNTWAEGTATTPEVIIEADVSDGSLVAGSLTESDKTIPYGTAATSTFKPYISDPSITGTQTSRLLRNRITQFCNVSFFLAPSPSLTYDNIRIYITVPEECKGTSLQQPALVNWNTETEEWQHEDEGCSSYLTSSETDGVYTANVCSSLRDIGVSRSKRATSTTSSTPTAYELVTITRDFINNPPNITTEEINTVEDAFEPTTIETYDLENDDLLFEITEMPVHANCSITSKGILDCVLEEDFNGDDQITINVTETNLLEGIQANSVQKTISIHVNPSSDFTDRFFVDVTGKVYRDKRPRMVQTFYTDANGTEIFHAGYIILATSDKDEMFAYDTFTRFSPLGSSTVGIQSVQMYKVYAQNLTLINRYSTVEAYNITFSFSKLLSGQMTLAFIATTKRGAFTPSIIIELYILKNPCVHGSCSHLLFGPVACHDSSRALSFEEYSCICETGYTDQWCQTNINDCASEPCSFLFDCEDLVNGFQCNINIPKLIAIIVCPLIVIGLVCFAIVRICKCVKKHKESDRTRILVVQSMDTEPNPLYRRPPLISEVTDGDIPPFSLFTNKPKLENTPVGITNIFGLGMKAPTHFLIQLNKERSSKVGIIGEEHNTTRSNGKVLTESSKESYAPRSTQFDQPKSVKSFTHGKKTTESTASLKAAPTTGIHQKIAGVTSVTKSDSTVKGHFKSKPIPSTLKDQDKKGPFETTSKSSSLYESSKTANSYDNAGFEQEPPDVRKTTKGSGSGYTDIEHSVSSETDIANRTEARSNLYNSIAMPSSEGSISQAGNADIKGSDVMKTCTASSMAILKIQTSLSDSKTKLKENESRQTHSVVSQDGNAIAKGTFTKEDRISAMALSEEQSSNPFRRIVPTESASMQARSHLQKSMDMSISDSNNIRDTSASNNVSQQSTEHALSLEKEDTQMNIKNLSQNDSNLATPVGFLNEQQARSKLQRPALMSSPQTAGIPEANLGGKITHNVNESHLTMMPGSEKSFIQCDLKPDESKDINSARDGSSDIQAHSNLVTTSVMSSVDSGIITDVSVNEELTVVKGEPQANAAKTGNIPGMNEGSSSLLKTPSKFTSYTNGSLTTTATHQRDVSVVTDQREVLVQSNPTHNQPKPATTISYSKGPPVQPAHVSKPTTNKPKRATKENYLKGPPPAAINYLKGPPTTTINYLKGPPAKPRQPDTSKTRQELEKRTKMMAKQFASLSLVLPDRSGPPQTKTATIKPKTAAKKKVESNKTQKKVSVRSGDRPDPPDNMGASNNTDSVNIGCQERPSSGMSDIEI